VRCQIQGNNKTIESQLHFEQSEVLKVVISTTIVKLNKHLVPNKLLTDYIVGKGVDMWVQGARAPLIEMFFFQIFKLNFS